jgi:hypothetical protein
MKLDGHYIIGLIITIVIGLTVFAALLPTASTAADAVNDTGAPLASSLFGGSTPLILLLLVVGVFMAAYGAVKSHSAKSR